MTEAVDEHIASVYAENSPARIYFLILYNLFAEFLDDISEDVLPNDRTGYQDTQVWQSLYNFQRDAATGIINKLETYNGCILADSVGLGKTFTALAVIKYYELRNKSVLVLAPKKLAENWTNYNANLTTNIFASDRFNYDVLAHTDLSRTRGESLGMRLDRINWGNYDLVVIDESHNFRNADYAEEKESRYQRLMRQVIREGVKTKVLMLSATPVNNRFNDLKNQLAARLRGRVGEPRAAAEHLDHGREGLPATRSGCSTSGRSCRPRPARPTRSCTMLDFDFFELLDAVTIARSRKHIQAFYDTTEIGAFPERLPADLDPRAAHRPARRRRVQRDLRAAPGTDARGLHPAGLRLPEQDRASTKTSTTSRAARRGPTSASRPRAGPEEAHDGQPAQAAGELGRGVPAHARRRSRAPSTRRSAASRLAHGAHVRPRRRLRQPGPRRRRRGRRSTSRRCRSARRSRSTWRTSTSSPGSATCGTTARPSASCCEEMEQGHPRPRRQAPATQAADRGQGRQPDQPGNRKVLIFSAFADTANYLYRELAPALSEAGLESAHHHRQARTQPRRRSARATTSSRS